MLESKIILAERKIVYPFLMNTNFVSHALAGLFCLLVSANVSAQPPTPSESIYDRPPAVRFTCSEPANSPIFMLMDRVYSDVFAQQGLRFEMVFVPNRRARSELKNGNIDGHCGRVSTTPPIPNTINSSVIIAKSDLVAASMHQPKIKVFNDLKQDPLRIGLVGGSTADQINIRYAIPFINIVDLDRGIKMLAADRLDYVISNSLQVMRSIDNMGGSSDDKPFILSTLIHQLPVTPILHESQTSTIDAFNASLQSIVNCHERGPITAESLTQWLERAEDETPMTTCKKTTTPS